MKLSNVFAKLTCIKAHAVRVLATAAVAGAVFAAAAPAAEAQQFRGEAHFTGPVQVAPRPVYGHERVVIEPHYRTVGPEFYGRDRGFYDHRRFEEHEAFLRHEEREHSHYRPYGSYR